MDIKLFLMGFGFSEKKVDVYLALLKGGPQPVRKVAQAAGVNRGTTYDILKNLITQGLVSYVYKEKHQHFVAENPDVLTRVLQEKERHISDLRQELDETVPILKSMYDRIGGKPVARFYEGKRGLRTILTDVLEVAMAHNKSYVAYSTAELRSPLYAAYPTFTEERIKRNIHVRVIAIGGGGFLKGLDERQWLARSDTQQVSTYTIIYGGKIALMSMGDEGDPFGLIIEDLGIATTQQFIFDWVWKQLGPLSHVNS